MISTTRDLARTTKKSYMSSKPTRRALSTPSPTTAAAAGTHRGPYTNPTSGTAAPLISRHVGMATAPSSLAVDMKLLRMAGGSCCNRENAAGATLLVGKENMVTGQVARLTASA